MYDISFVACVLGGEGEPMKLMWRESFFFFFFDSYFRSGVVDIMHACKQGSTLINQKEMRMVCIVSRFCAQRGINEW